MNRDHSDPSCLDDVPTRSSPHPPSTSTSNSNATISVIHEEDLASPSQNSSPALTSILLSPSENNASRPRSSEGRVTSLNLPKHTSHSSRSHVHSLGGSRRRVVPSGSYIRSDEEGRGNERPNVMTDDGLLNFGLGDEFALIPEDPQLKEDVQRVLKAKALRESRSRSEAVVLAPQTPAIDLSQVRAREDVPTPPQATTHPFPATPPKRAVSSSTRPVSTQKSTHPNITFPPHVHSPTLSLESISSYGQPGRTPLPIKVTSQNGITCLDWSGALPAQGINEKEKSLLGRTFSLTRRKYKGETGLANLAGRRSVDFAASQGELHTATLDSIKRTARRDTLSRAEKMKDELSRRYAFLSHLKPTGEPELDILDIVRSRDDHTNVQTPWLAWCRRLLLSRQKASVWTLTADSIEEYLQASGHHPTRPSFVPSTRTNISMTRSHSPSFSYFSPLSSPRSSLSTSPLNNDGARNQDRGRMEFNLRDTLATNGEGERTPSASWLADSDRLSNAAPVNNSATPISIEQRHSVDIVKPENGSFSNLNRSPRSSLDQGSDLQPKSSFSTTERGSSKRKKFRESLAAEKTKLSTKLSLESRSSISSVTNLFGSAQSSHGASPTSARLHLGVGNMFGFKRRGGDEAAGENLPSRSSVSDERDSAKEGEGAKSDDAEGLKGGLTITAPGLDIRGFISRGKEALIASDSEPSGGLLTAKIGKKFLRSEKDRPKARSFEGVAAEFPQESVSGGEQRKVDAEAGPGWSLSRGVRRARTSAPKEMEKAKLQQILQKRAEEEEHEKEIYKARELLLIAANDHNRRIARLLKIICASVREHEDVQFELAQAVGFRHPEIPSEVLDAICTDPAITLRHGKGCQAVESSHHRFQSQQAVLMSYLSTPVPTTEDVASSDLGDYIHEAEDLWRGLQRKIEEIERQAATVIPALDRAVKHTRDAQNEYNATRMLVETDYQEQSRLMDLETIITESRIPRGWLEFAAVWIPEHVLKFIGGFIRFFGVPISEKFIRPFLWYFFRSRYYWKIYSTEPPPSKRAWYTRLGYWIIIFSILAWYSTS